MKLEDFFTLTEMSNGLTTPSRVEELVSMMQKERECVVKNAGETTKQWSAVACAIAATENKECLELFIQLDGLSFIQSWLSDALRFGSETGEDFVDESISHLIDHLLRAVERLHVDDKKSVSSGIWLTVKSLLDHSSSKVQERAKALFDSWDRGKDDCMVSVGTEKVQASIDERTRDTAVENGLSEPSSVEGGSGEEKSKEHVGDDKIPSSRSDIYQSRAGDTATSDQSLEHTHTKDACPGSSLSNSFSEGHKVEHPIDHAECATNAIDTSNTCTSIVPRPDAVDEQTDIPVSDSINHLDHIEGVRSSEKFNSAVSISLEDRTISLVTDVREALDALAASDLQQQTDVLDENNCSEKSSFGDASVTVPKGETSVDDSRPENNESSTIVVEAKENRNCDNDLRQDSDRHNMEHPVDSVGGGVDKHASDNSGDKHASDNSEDKHISDNSEDKHTSDNSEDNRSDNSEDDMENESEFQEAGKGGRDSGVFGSKSDIDFDYGIMDPLELARQVAIEVEREVQSCSSSEEIEESKVHEPGSPDSINAKERQKGFECSNVEVSRGTAPSTEASLANSEAKPINGTVNVESSQVVDATLDLETNVEKGFDLNLEVCSDDIDSSVNGISTSVSVVSASRAAAAPGVPVTPLQFEGTLGWKGSAATSAFRPASPRRIPGGEKAVSSGGNDSSSKQMQSFHDIDLNVVSESVDDRVADLFPEKKVPLSSTLPLRKSSPEANQRKTQMLEWDLNCASEEGEAPSDWCTEGTLLALRNGHLSQSPSSSSSSKQPSLRNIDLNDQSSFLNDFSNLNNFKKPPQNSTNASGGTKSGDSVVSIMGMKVEVNRKDFAAQSFPFPNGRVAENAVDHTVARGGVLGMGPPFQYTPLPAFGYSGIAPVPPMAFSSSMYGPSGHIPYMVDSRVAPVVPQIGGSASAIPPSFSQQSFILNMGSAPVPNGVWPSRSTGLDLDTGLVLDHRGNKDVGGLGLRQLFDQGQARPMMDEHFRISLQPSTNLSIGGKRKEPDGGWGEPSPFKHHPPPWK